MDLVFSFVVEDRIAVRRRRRRVRGSAVLRPTTCLRRRLRHRTVQYRAYCRVHLLPTALLLSCRATVCSITDRSVYNIVLYYPRSKKEKRGLTIYYTVASS